MSWILNLFRKECQGIKELKALAPYSVSKLSYGQITFSSGNMNDRYTLVYSPEHGSAELWCFDDLIYETEDPIEAMDMYLFLKRFING